jgi:tetratricopeptide (TPR) repeat protein
VRSNLAREALGRRLRDSGRIDESTFEESVRRLKATGNREGDILVQLGAISEGDLRNELTNQATDKLLDIFAWTEGRAWTQPGVRSMTLSSALTGWTPRQIVLRGASRVSDKVVAKRLEPFLACEVSQDNLQLEEGESVDDVAALWQELAQRQPVRLLLDRYAATLYALWLIGALDLGAGQAGKSASLPGVGAAAVEIELGAKLRDALAAFEGASHFQVLGIANDASDTDVRQAYTALAKVFHPDKVGRRAPGLVELAAKVFARIAEASDTLGSPDLRAKYVARKSNALVDNQAASRILTAEQQYRGAEDAMRRKDWARALECLGWALELDPEEGEFHSLRGWIMFLKQQDQGYDETETAIGHLKKGIALSPNSPTGYFFLGQIRKVCGETVEAEKMFRKTIEVRPNHVEALRELRLMELRRAKGDDTIAGMLFGRKKK